MPRKRQVTNLAIFRVLCQMEGRISDTAEEMNLTVSFIKHRVERDPQLKAKLDFYKQALLDEAIKQARTLVESGDRTMILHILKTLGRKEGYAETTVIEGGDKPLQISHSIHHEINFDVLPLEARRSLLVAMRAAKATPEAEADPIELEEASDGVYTEYPDGAPVYTAPKARPRKPAPSMFNLSLDED